MDKYSNAIIVVYVQEGQLMPFHVTIDPKHLRTQIYLPSHKVVAMGKWE